MKIRCNTDYYQSKVHQPALLEQQYEKGETDLLYGDETQVSEEGYVPYGWQLRHENVCIASHRGTRINCFGLLNRDNDFIYQTTMQTITADFVNEQLDSLFWRITKHTVVVLDNARVHQNKKMQAMQAIWAKRNRFIFFLPPYSPHLNIIERLWKEMKGRWFSPSDYRDEQTLCYALNRILSAAGTRLTIHFKPFHVI